MKPEVVTAVTVTVLIIILWYVTALQSDRDLPMLKAASVVQGLACWPLVPKFAGTNPAEAVRFLRAEKSSARLPSEGK
jgi:hypothetical protein